MQYDIIGGYMPYIHMHKLRYICNVKYLGRQYRGIGCTYIIHIRVIKFLRNFEFRNWHAMRGGRMLPDYISEEKLEND